MNWSTTLSEEQLTAPSACSSRATSGSAEYICAVVNAFVSKLDTAETAPSDVNLELVDACLTKALKSVRALRNVKLPVMQLPPEVLSSIFRMVGEHGVDEWLSTDASSPCNLHAWLAVTTVCQHWRSVAVNDPRLWTNIIVEELAVPEMPSLHTQCGYARLSLQRSQQCPLTVRLNLDYSSADLPECYDLLADIVSELPRIRELHVAGEWLCNPGIVPLLTNADAPCLHVLSIDFDESMDDLVPTLFHGDIPTLQSFALLRHVSTFEGFRFSNLKQLHLMKQLYFNALEIYSLLELLDTCPSLENLMFSDVACVDLSVEDPGSPVYRHLPNLKKVAFCNVEFQDAGNLLSCIQLPPAASVTYSHVFNEDASWQDLFFSPVSNPMLGLPSSFTAVLINFHPECNDICAFTETIAFRASGTILLEAEKFERYYSDAASVLLPSTKELWLQGFCPDDVAFETCQAIADSATDIERLFLDLNDLRSQVLYHLIPLLKPYPPSEAARPPLCPQLQEIHLISPPGDSLVPLMCVLKERQQEGFPLDTLCIHPIHPLEDCHLCPADVLQRLGDFDEWKKHTPTMLRPYVKNIRFGCNQTSIHLPPICFTPDSGDWEWPTWDDMVPGA
ncbi:hypothetical protein NM688_g8484 [Phlebia brevispora]|uniref:Uncharacterized protein n=1 Tax=Phlebia brevispora TaxID=194682 RepID=A0ACC1RQW9_9APHY|nr:hypothetical protein NM688_g8484 [Phlebia brevispora]